MLGKKTIFHEVNIFECPVCKASFKMHTTGMECDKGHTFRIEHGRFVNFSKHNNEISPKESYVARQNFYFTGMFACLTDKIATMIDTYCKKDTILMVDANCADGALFCQICDSLENEFDKHILGLGLDGSAFAIEAASTLTKGVMWCVGDNSHIPCKDKTFDVAFSNVFTKLDYNECKRCLKDDGIVIRVLRGPQYIKEFVSADILDDYYGDCGTLEEFKEHFELIHSEEIFYKENILPRTIDELAQIKLIDGKSTEEVRKDTEICLKDGLTVDLILLVGKKK